MRRACDEVTLDDPHAPGDSLSREPGVFSVSPSIGLSGVDAGVASGPCGIWLRTNAGPRSLPMNQQKCPRCLRSLWPDDTVTVNDERIAHLDCQRPRDLSREERVLLFRYCWGHVVAKCAACDQSFPQQQLGSDLLGHRTHLCPRCRADLTEGLRGHLYACTMLPEEVRRRAQEARDAARRLVKQSRQLSDCADVLMREAEAAVDALRETMRRAAGV